MTEFKRNQIITELAESLQAGDYGRFLSYFEENAVFELPFRVDGGILLKGLPEIRKHFESVAEDPMEKLVRIEEVMTKSYEGSEAVTVEYFTKGRLVSTGETFHIQSAIAIIRFGETGIVYYKDIPNTLGMAKRTGTLNQLAASWEK
ncbi:nuclear transport factor 2 family protein [Fluviicola taffensis]|uniref:nuclear transport factor 2 family protein n=1 Tax=Fluviicola taffensis TaxID=191579 RepID=UPI003137FC49